MSQLTEDRNTPVRYGEEVILDVGASQKIYAGAIVCVNATGYAVEGSTSTTLICVGRAEEQVDNSAGGDGDLTICVRRGIFKFANSAGGDAITDAEIGARCYIVDDQTVAKTNGTGTRSTAGIVYKVDSDGVWVDMRSDQRPASVDTADISDDAVTFAKIQNAAANTIICRDANSEGDVSAKALTNTQILICDGTGFTAAALSGDATMTNAGVVSLADTLVKYATVTLTNSQIKGLRAAPKTLVAAPGANKLLEFVSAILFLDYGSEALTESTDNMAIRYHDGSGAIVSQAIESGSFIDATADTVTNALPKIDAVVATASAFDKALVLHNTGDGEFAGNASNDTTMKVKIAYRIHDFS